MNNPKEWGLHPHEEQPFIDWLNLMSSKEVHIKIIDGKPRIICFEEVTDSHLDNTYLIK